MTKTDLSGFGIPRFIYGRYRSRKGGRNGNTILSRLGAIIGLARDVIGLEEDCEQVVLATSTLLSHVQSICSQLSCYPASLSDHWSIGFLGPLVAHVVQKYSRPWFHALWFWFYYPLFSDGGSSRNSMNVLFNLLRYNKYNIFLWGLDSLFYESMSPWKQKKILFHPNFWIY